MIDIELVLVGGIVVTSVFLFFRFMRRQINSDSGCGKSCSASGKTCSQCPSSTPQHRA